MRYLRTSARFKWNKSDIEITDAALAGMESAAKKVTLKVTHLHPEDHAGMKEHLKTLPSHGASAIEHYRGIGHNDYNKELRHPSHKGRIRGNGDYNFTEHSLHKLHDGMEHATSYKLKHATKVYRGLGEEASNHVKHLAKGSTFVDHGYASTTHDPKVAMGSFAQSSHEGTHRMHHVVKIHLPKGSKILHMPAHSDSKLAQHEQETLLHHGTKFKVLGHSVHHLESNPNGHHSQFDSTQHKIHVTHVKLVGQRRSRHRS